ncbi:MAG TPA: glycosyltransferase family 2 protein [Chthoniobacteraceae bacterium]|jgi:GT2 family glycosyltransferase|nr:glycosyltransferase family 2 protein [Chthoniobacteraceae bacterium]
MRVSVIVITLNRPDYVSRCIRCLLAQTKLPHQIIVVDASVDDATAKLVAADFPGVTYLRNDRGRGRMTTSRNLGLKHAAGEVIAFLDDDSFAEPQWLENLAATYAGDEIGAAGGRALNGQPDEATRGVDEIGQIRANGLITQNFAADPGRIVDVDIIIGCNMSFRRDVLAALGGFREHYTGYSGSCEDTDICLRVKKLGYKIRFNPAACVEHKGAPQFKGRRFDLRYELFGYRNYLMLLIVNYGFFSRFFWGAVAWLVLSAIQDFIRRVGGGFLLAFSRIAGGVAGCCLGCLLRLSLGADPRRHDREGEEIRQSLEGGSVPSEPPIATVGSAAPLS